MTALLILTLYDKHPTYLTILALTIEAILWVMT